MAVILGLVPLPFGHDHAFPDVVQIRIIPAVLPDARRGVQTGPASELVVGPASTVVAMIGWALGLATALRAEGGEAQESRGLAVLPEPPHHLQEYG